MSHKSLGDLQSDEHQVNETLVIPNILKRKSDSSNEQLEPSVLPKKVQVGLKNIFLLIL